MGMLVCPSSGEPNMEKFRTSPGPSVRCCCHAARGWMGLAESELAVFNATSEVSDPPADPGAGWRMASLDGVVPVVVGTCWPKAVDWSKAAEMAMVLTQRAKRFLMSESGARWRTAPARLQRALRKVSRCSRVCMAADSRQSVSHTTFGRLSASRTDSDTD